MADLFVDDSVVGGNDDGSDWDMNPFNTGGNRGIKTAFESTNLTGNKVWIRRTSVYDEAIAAQDADIAPADDGTADTPIEIIGWPRAAIPNTTITEGAWTNGSTTVDNIVGITCDRPKHQARWAIAPDGYKYLITRVVDSNTIIIDREYGGSTVTGTDGAFQIEADEDYSTRPNADGLRAAWDADPHDLPIIDFNNEAYQLYVASDNFYVIRNMEIKDGADGNGIIQVGAARHLTMEGMLFKQNSNAEVFRVNTSHIVVKRFTAEGSGAGSLQVFQDASAGNMTLIDGAIYNMGDHGLETPAQLELINMNIGVEIANGDDDILIQANTGTLVFGRDVKLGGTKGLVLQHSSKFARPGFNNNIGFENYGKVLGEHRMFYSGGIAQRSAVTGETPNKKLSDYVLKITPNNNYVYKYEEGQCLLFEHEYELEAGANTIKYWLYNDTGATLNNGDAQADIYLAAEYVDSYGSTSQYTITKAYSTQDTIEDAADADDWDFLSVTMTLATASKVRVRLLISYYDVTGDIFIDPQGLVN